MTKNSTSFALALVLAFSLSTAIQAAPIASDDFESYGTGALAGENGGSGWTGAWGAGAGSFSVDVVNSALSYSGGVLASSGGSNAVEFQWSGVGEEGVTDSLLSRSLSSSQTGTVYMSLLFRDTVNSNDANDFLQFGFDPVSDNGNPNTSVVRENNGFGARAGTGGTDFSGTASAPGTTHLMVFKAQAPGASFSPVSLFLDPTTAAEPGSADAADAASSGITSLGTFLARSARHDNGDTFQIDNIRVGTTWADVVSINPNIIANYQLDVPSTVVQDSADIVGANTTAGNFHAIINGALSTVPGTGGAGISGSNNNAFLDRAITGETITASTNDYFTFTVTPDAGYEFNFDNITFDYLVNETSGITYFYELRSSIDNFASVLGTATNVGAPFSFAEDVDLSSLAAQSSAVEFRFLFADTNDGPNILHRIDNVVLFGTATEIVTPEPGSLLLAAFGVVGLSLVRRRRRGRTRTMTRSLCSLILLGPVLTSVGGIQLADAATIASDSFLIDSDPNVGYEDGKEFDGSPAGTDPQGPDTTGMTLANWANGGTGLWRSRAAGLDFSSTAGEAGGSARWEALPFDRNVSRALDSAVSVSTGQTYWMAMLVEPSGTLDTVSGNLALAGFGNTDNPTDTGAASGLDDPQGYWVGVQSDGSELDLVLHHRSSSNNMATDVLLDGIALDQTHLVVLKSIVNVSGSVEGLSVWVDPSNVSTEALLGTPVSGLSVSQALFNTAFDQLSFYGDNLATLVQFDEIALGTELSDVVSPFVATPEPGSLLLAAFGVVGLSFTRRRRRA